MFDTNRRVSVTSTLRTASADTGIYYNRAFGSGPQTCNWYGRANWAKLGMSKRSRDRWAWENICIRFLYEVVLVLVVVIVFQGSGPLFVVRLHLSGKRRQVEHGTLIVSNFHHRPSPNFWLSTGTWPASVVLISSMENHPNTAPV